MIQQYTITSDAWTAITANGEDAICWLDEDNDGAVGRVEVRIYHTDQGEPSADVVTEGKRAYRPDENGDVMHLAAAGNGDIYYARCMNPGDQALLTVDTGPGGIGLPGKLAVEKVDQISAWNDFYFAQANGAPTALTSAVSVGDRSCTVDSVASISIGDWVGILGGTENDERYFWSHVTGVAGNVVTFGTLIDYPFSAGATVLSTTTDMAVDGSVTPQVFSIRAGDAEGNLEIDITRIMMACLTDSAVDLSTFGDIAGGLARGMYLRVKENGVYRNKAIFRTNFDLAQFAYDWTPFTASNPSQGQDGFNWRFSLNGDDKHGAVTRVSGGDVGTIEWVVQDDLTDLALLQSVGANHEVD